MFVFSWRGKGIPRTHFQMYRSLPSPCVMLDIPVPIGQRIQQAVGIKKNPSADGRRGRGFSEGGIAVPVAGHRGNVLAGGHRFQKAPGT